MSIFFFLALGAVFFLLASNTSVLLLSVAMLCSLLLTFYF